MKVTVSLITYNHAPFIRQAIDSVLMQQTDFDFELLIGEDESTDGTREIVRDYEARHPGKIRVLYNDRKNVVYYNGKATGQFNFINNLKNARGQYIALLEGDDYWTSPHKLQKQADYLDQHPECSLCFHDVMIVFEDGSPSRPYGFHIRQPFYTLPQLLERWAVPPTGSVMFRNGLFSEFPDWFYRLAFADQPLFVLCAEHGHLGLLAENMGGYRVHSSGFWSQGFSNMKRLPANIIKSRCMADIEYYEVIDAHLGRKYHRLIQERISELSYQLVWVYQTERNWAAMRKYLCKAYRSRLVVPEFAWTFVVKASLVAFLPSLYRCYRWLKSPRQADCAV